MIKTSMAPLTSTIAITTIALLVTWAPAALATSESDASVQTYFTVLLGHPTGQEAADSGVLLVPGTVIPITGTSTGSGEHEKVVERSLSYLTVVNKLWSTFRLDPERRRQTATYQAVAVDQPLSLPSPAGSITISATLLGYNDSTGTYRIVFRQDGQAIADSTVNVERGGRAVVGGMDGDEAPYLFVFIEPDPPRPEDGKFRYHEGIGITEPVKREARSPSYPKSARRDRMTGLVVLDLQIDSEGKVVDHAVLKDPDPRLTAAAVEAVRQWVFEPARYADGTPVTVWYVITIKFNLE